MERRIFKDTAFTHGYGQEDFDAVMRHRHLVFRSRRGYCNVYELLGRNDAGDSLHVITRRYRVAAERVVIVFHMNRMNAMDKKRFIQMMRRP